MRFLRSSHRRRRVGQLAASVIGLMTMSFLTVWQSTGISMMRQQQEQQLIMHVVTTSLPQGLSASSWRRESTSGTSTGDPTQNTKFTSEESDQALRRRFAEHPAPRRIEKQGKRCHYSLPKHNYTVVEVVGDYGLGHRLARLAVAGNVAYRVKGGLHAFWGCCEKEEAFSHFFGDQPLIWENPPSDPDPIHLQFRDNHGGFEHHERHENEKCRCLAPDAKSKIQSDHILYSHLVERFRYKHKLVAFMDKHEFANHTVIGMHIRGGNGEKGDFAVKRRGIANVTAFLETTSAALKNLSRNFADPPLLFLATDTPSMVGQLRNHLEGTVPVIAYPVIYRPKENEGVDSLWKEKKTGKECLDEWESVISDQFLLAQTDVVVVTKPSSFVHTTPLFLALGRDQTKVSRPFCEFEWEGQRQGQLHCFESVQQWCCERPNPGKVDFFVLKEDWRDHN